MTALIPDLIAMSHDLPLLAAAGKIPQNTCDAWVKTVDDAVERLKTTSKDSEMLDFVENGSRTLQESEGRWICCACYPDDAPSYLWKNTPREAIAAAMQKESEVPN